MTSSSFGPWYDTQKSGDNGDSDSGGLMSGWLSTESLPLFDPTAITTELPTFAGMKASLEAQLPQKVLGMNYQQRFQVRIVIV
jgi:hypothetical protein